MPRINYKATKGWSNYHLTVSNDIDEHGSYDAAELGACDAPSSLSGPRRFAATRGELHKFIAKALRQDKAAGMLGKAWSFSALVGNHNLELDLTGLAGCSIAKPAELHSDCAINPHEIAYVSGGTTLRCLAEWAAKLEPRMSITTSGTHLGPTVAGGFGTASHGSRLGFGGLQDMILGVHLIVSGNRSVWVERADTPVLKTATARRFASTVIRSDDIFEDVLIHLGGMGIVNGVALRLEPYQAYNVLAVSHPLWPGWEEQVESGAFEAISTRLGHPAEPCFYEVTIDPFDNDGERRAIHLMYYPAPAGILPPEPGEQVHAVHASDAIAMMVQAILHQMSEKDVALLKTSDPEPQFSAFSYYEMLFKQAYAPFKLPIDADAETRGWERLHTDEITTDMPGALYNASYSVPREDVGRALDAILKASQRLAQSFLYTIRFVTNPSGTLKFTRFAENAVIEIDGVSDRAPSPVYQLGVHTKTGAMKVRTELDMAGIDYSMHWAKLGQLDQPKVEHDFGPARDAASPIARWRATRDLLLPPKVRPLFVNNAIRDYGLI